MNPEVNNTNTENPQDEVQLETDQLAAAMGFMTTLGEQNMMAQMATDEEAQGEEQMMEEEKPEIDPEALKEEIKGELVGEVRKDLKKLIKQELEGLLEEEDAKDTDTKTTE